MAWEPWSMGACHLHRASAEPEVTQKVFMDLTVGGKPVGAQKVFMVFPSVHARTQERITHRISTGYFSP